jgi:hypothetical protein
MYPNASYTISKFPLNPGDIISASVTYSGNNTFTMCLYNHTKGIVTTVPTPYTKSSTAQRNSAEWIIEAPYLTSVLPLTNFGTIYLSQCNATINGIAHTLNSSVWNTSSMEMITNNGTPKAIPSTLTNGGSFSVQWKHQ